MFINHLITEKIGPQTFILLEDLIYQNDEAEFIFKAGFDFDAASIPKALWSIIGSPFTGDYVKAATGHDVLYSVEFQNNRELCDNLFLEMMKADGVGYFKRYSMYWAVRSFGWAVWKNHKKEEVNEYQKFLEVTYSNSIC